MLDLAKMVLFACGSLALVHCATPNLAGCAGGVALMPATGTFGARCISHFSRRLGVRRFLAILSSSRSGQWDIYVAQKSAAGFEAPQRVEELHAAAASRQPMVSEDGLTILFASERPGGAGQRDLWIARRTSVTRPFSTPEVLANVNSASDEYAGWLSGDGCRIYFSSDRSAAKQHQIYVASRPAGQPKP